MSAVGDILTNITGNLATDFTKWVGRKTSNTELVRKLEKKFNPDQLHQATGDLIAEAVAEVFNDVPDDIAQTWRPIIEHPENRLQLISWAMEWREEVAPEIGEWSIENAPNPDMLRGLLLKLHQTLQSKKRKYFGPEFFNLMERFDEVTAKLDQIASGQAEQQKVLSGQIQHLAQQKGIDATVEYTVTVPVLEIPPLVSPLAQRQLTVAKIVEAIKTHPWTILRKESGSGKTQLAALAANSVGTCRAWIRLRDLTIEQACARLDASASRISGLLPELGPERLYQAMGRKIGKGALLVVEDVPQLSGDDELSVRLLCLVRACQDCGVSLLSTTWYAMPVKIPEACGRTMLVLEPELSDEEAGEILTAYGAPEHIRKPSTITFLNTIARRHPLLLAAVAHYLADTGWKFTEHAFDGLLRGAHALAINMETMRQLLATVEDEKTRELVYRLNLIGAPFSLADVELLASVQPKVERPSERVSSVLGICVQADSNERMVVSPLIASLGTADLDGEVRKKCHMALGGQIMHQRTVTPLEIMQCIAHFQQAEAWDLAGSMFLISLSKLNEMRRPVDDLGILAMWSDLPLPEGMSLYLRISIRSLQIHLRNARGQPIAYLAKDLDKLMDQAAPTDAWSILSACTFAGPAIGRISPALANKHLLTALRLMPGARWPDGKPFVLPKELRPEGLIWLNASYIKTSADLIDWIKTFEQFTDQQRKVALEDPFAEDGSKIVADQLLLEEGKKPKADQNWKFVGDALRDYAVRARALGNELLWACAMRALILVQGRSLKDTNKALEIGKSALTDATNDPRVQFVITQGLGEQFLVSGKNAEALDWLKRAVECATDAYPSVRMEALVEASCAVGPTDANKAVEYATLAVRMAEETADIHPVDAVKPHAELAYAYFLTGDLRTAFHAWDKAGELLLACQSDKDYWKELFVLFGHVSGYMTTLTCTGSPPSQTADDEPYGETRRGMFLFYDKRVIAIFDEANISVVCAQLALFAEALGEDEKAFSWAVKGMELAKKAGNTTAYASNALKTLHQLLSGGKYEDALLTALEAAPSIIAAPKRTQQERKESRFKFDVTAVLGPKPNDDWRRAERFAATYSLIPAIFSLGSLITTDPDAARQKAVGLVAICRKIAQNAVDPDLWNTVADLTDQIFVQRVSAEELFRRSQTFDKDQQAVELTICLLGAGLQNDISLVNAVRLHLAIFPTIQKEMETSPAIYRRIILAFLQNFWRQNLQSQRFSFSTPNLVERAFDEALKATEPQRAQRILVAIAGGLRVKLNSKDETWLRAQ